MKIKLCHGAGDGIERGCILTASNMLLGKGQSLDANNCVCDIISGFAILTNDNIPEEYLEELYGPLVEKILGTKTNNLEVIRERTEIIFDLAYELDVFCGDDDDDNYRKYDIFYDGDIDQFYKNAAENVTSLIIDNYCDVENDEFDYYKKFADALSEMCNIGEKISFEQVMSVEELSKKLNLFEKV